MKNKIRDYQIFSIIFMFVVGTLLQFTYEWSNENVFVGIFSTINECVWEHLKLVYFPGIITIIIGCFYLKKDICNFICAKTVGIISAMVFIVIFFYTYTGILGFDIAIIDIASYFIAVLIGEYISYRLMISKSNCNNIVAIIILVVLFVCFVTFTFTPPKINIFKDKLTNTYGINKNE